MRRMRFAVIAALAGLLAAKPASHIPTWAYDEYHAQGGSAGAADVRRYVTYAEGGLGNDKAVRDCGGSSQCRSVWYFDPHLIYDSPSCPYQPDQRFINAASESWFVHRPGFDDTSHRVVGHYSRSCDGRTVDVPVYVANIANRAVQAFWRRYLDTQARAWRYVLVDDAGATLVNQMYGPGGGFCAGMNLQSWCTSTEEFANDAALLHAQGSFARAMRRTHGTPVQMFVNGDAGLATASRQYIGFVRENYIVDAGMFRTTMYAPTLSAMATIQNAGDRVVILDTGDSPAGSADQIAQRLVTTAIVWLGFRPNLTVVWPDLEYNTMNLAVWPEDGVYPTRPLESMRSSAADIAVAPGIWRREFASCYLDGRAVGGCAAVLNANANGVVVRRAWLRRRYAHTLVLDGGDALHGGSLSRGFFKAGRSVVPGGRALLLLQ